MNFFKQFIMRFVKTSETPIKTSETPMVDEIWYIPNLSPWEKEETKVKIIELKDGWVRYQYIPSNGCSELVYDTFMGCYKYLGREVTHSGVTH